MTQGLFHPREDNECQVRQDVCFNNISKHVSLILGHLNATSLWQDNPFVQQIVRTLNDLTKSS